MHFGNFSLRIIFSMIFFLRSGFLVAYITLKKMDKAKSFLNFLAFVLHRFIRWGNISILHRLFTYLSQSVKKMISFCNPASSFLDWHLPICLPSSFRPACIRTLSTAPTVCWSEQGLNTTSATNIGGPTCSTSTTCIRGKWRKRCDAFTFLLFQSFFFCLVVQFLRP